MKIPGEHLFDIAELDFPFTSVIKLSETDYEIHDLIECPLGSCKHIIHPITKTQLIQFLNKEVTISDLMRDEVKIVIHTMIDPNVGFLEDNTDIQYETKPENEIRKIYGQAYGNWTYDEDLTGDGKLIAEWLKNNRK